MGGAVDGSARTAQLARERADEREALQPVGGRIERRAVGLGSGHRDAVLLRPVHGVARARLPRRQGRTLGVVRRGAPRRPRSRSRPVEQRGDRTAGADRLRAPHPQRRRHLSSAVVPSAPGRSCRRTRSANRGLPPRHRTPQTARGATPTRRALRRGDGSSEPPAVPRAAVPRDCRCPRITRAALRRRVPRPRRLQARQRLARPSRRRSAVDADGTTVARRAARSRPRRTVWW